MASLHPLPDTSAFMRPIIRGARKIAQISRHDRFMPVTSQLVCLAVDAIFALWMLKYYHPIAGPAWIGMTIRIGVFAIWAEIARELFVQYSVKSQKEDS